MTSSLIRVGNSKAVIIPAKLLRKLDINDDTDLSLNEESGVITISKVPVPVDKLHFPKVSLKGESEELRKLRRNRISFTKEEIESDERLAYILSR